MVEKKARTDWEAMEPEWRSGIKSVLQLSKDYGVSRAAIMKHWAKEGLERDLSAKIAAKAEALVTQALVTQEVAQKRRVTEKKIIETNAVAISSIRLSHRQDLVHSRGIVNSMLAELSHHCGPENAELMEQLGNMMRNPDDCGQDRLNDLYRKVISLPGRAKTMKDLAESLSKLIDKERQAFGLDKEGADDDKAKTMTDAQRASRIAALLAKVKEA